MLAGPVRDGLAKAHQENDASGQPENRGYPREDHGRRQEGERPACHMARPSIARAPDQPRDRYPDDRPAPARVCGELGARVTLFVLPRLCTDAGDQAHRNALR